MSNTLFDYTYKAFCYNVVDGDTFDFICILTDYGFRKYVMAMERFRLYGIDVWEIHHKNLEHKKRGEAAKQRVEELILYHWIELKSYKKPGKYGRWLAEISFEMDGETKDLATILKLEGHEKISQEKAIQQTVDNPRPSQRILIDEGHARGE